MEISFVKKEKEMPEGKNNTEQNHEHQEDKNDREHSHEHDHKRQEMKTEKPALKKTKKQESQQKLQ